MRLLSLRFPIPVCVAVLIKAGRVLELFFRDIGAIAVELGIVFERWPRQAVMAFETAEEAPKIDGSVSNLTADALHHEVIDRSHFLAIRAVNGSALYFAARDQAFAASGRGWGLSLAS